MDYSTYQLNDNPFRIAPAINPDDIVWAGMEALKEKFIKRIKAGAQTSPSRLVLNWGKYGSGKTHAANFFTKTNYIKEELGLESLNIKVNLPRSSKDPVQAFLRSLLGQINFDHLIEDFKKLHNIYAGELDEIVVANSQDSVIADVIKLLYDEKGEDLFGKKPAIKDALKNYLYGDRSKKTLDLLNTPIGLDDDEQVVNLLSGIFNCLTYEKKLYKSVFLWIDEFEDIDTLPKSGQDRFTTFLRQLLDKTPNNLTIFLNFTLKVFGDIEDLSFFLGEALKSRIKTQISFDEPGVEECKTYISDLLNNKRFRPDSADGGPIYFPFTEDMIEYVLEHLDSLSIRKINESFSLLLELALLEDNSPKVIDKAFVEHVSDELIHWVK